MAGACKESTFSFLAVVSSFKNSKNKEVEFGFFFHGGFGKHDEKFDCIRHVCICSFALYDFVCLFIHFL